MMNAATGEVLFDTGEALGPSLTRSAFLASPLAVGATALGAGFALARRDIGGEAFVPTLWFDGEPLARLELSMVMPTEATSWDDYSEDRELARKAKHDAWLAGQLGPLPWQFTWGNVTSEFDPRGGSSTIVITYRSRPGTAVFDVQTVSIRAATGEIALDTGECVGPGLTLTRFLASRLGGAAARARVPGANPRASFPLDLRLPAGELFSLRLLFNGEVLPEVVFSMTEPGEPPVAEYRRHWADDAILARLVRDNELARKARHDAWLQTQLGPPPWSYPWGTVGSNYDAVFCRSDVIVEYR